MVTINIAGSDRKARDPSSLDENPMHSGVSNVSLRHLLVMRYEKIPNKMFGKDGLILRINHVGKGLFYIQY